MKSEILERRSAILSHYPREISLRDGRSFTIAPVGSNDREALREYLDSVPEKEQLILWNDVSVIVEQWCDHVEGLHTLSLLVWQGPDRIVGDGMLYQEPGVWSTRIGKLRAFVHPDVRGGGIGSEIVRELLEAARACGLRKVVADCIEEETAMLSLLKKIGFDEAARFPRFVQDRHGELHDMTVMVHHLA